LTGQTACTGMSVMASGRFRSGRCAAG
jgi:hypothetical protein